MGLIAFQSPAVDANSVGVQASHNPLYLGLRTDSTGAAAQQAFLTFRVIFPVSVGDSFTLNGVTYTASDDPLAGEFMASTHPFGPTNSQVARDIVNRLTNDPRLNVAYLFESSGNVISMGAVNSGALFDIAASYSPASSPTGPFQQLALIPGQDFCDGQQSEDYRIYAQIQINTFLSFPTVAGFTTGWRTIATLYKEWSRDNSHYFDLSGVLQPWVSSSPPSLAAGFQNKTGLVAYRVRYGEHFTPSGSENPIEVEDNEVQVNWITDSALPNNQANDLTDYYQPGSPVRQWLTSRPSGASVREEGYLFLYFMYYDPIPLTGTKYIALSISATFLDGTTADAGRYFASVATPGIRGIRVDPESWNMAAFQISNNKPVKSYTVTLVQSTTITFSSFTVISQAHTCVIDRKCEQFEPITFLWLEPLGSYTAHSFVGDRISEPQIQSTRYIRGRTPASIDPKDQVEAVQSVRFDLEHECSTGLLDAATFEWIRDTLLSSPQVYVIIDDILHAIVVTGSKAQTKASSNVTALSITYRLTQPQNVIAQ